jgi:hypothetical protein
MLLQILEFLPVSWLDVRHWAWPARNVSVSTSSVRRRTSMVKSPTSANSLGAAVGPIGSDMTSMGSDCLSQSTVRDEVARCGSVDEPTALTSAKFPEVAVGVPRA